MVRYHLSMQEQYVSWLFSLYIFSELKTFSFLFQTISNSTKNEFIAKEDLHIYIIDSNNVKQSLKCLENKMKERTRRDKECWFIDISAFKNIANASSMMNTLSLDVDDDTFLYMFVAGDSARIWEMYKLAPERDIIIKDFGSWVQEIGLKSTNLGKWQRRGDLSVSISILKWKYLKNISLYSAQIKAATKFLSHVTLKFLFSVKWQQFTQSDHERIVILTLTGPGGSY